MDKETKNVIFILLTIILNVIAPILMINTIRDYTRSSKVYGEPPVYEVSDYVNPSSYLFQENLSTISYTAETSDSEIKYTYNYYFEAIDLDTTQNNYSVFVNDYICTIDNLDARSISSTHLHDFYDINKNLINSVELTIEFRSYTTYTTLLITITAYDNDLSYWNSYCSNPGFVLTLSKVEYGMSGNLYTPIDPNTEYTVNFIVDNQVISSQSILFGDCAVLPDYELVDCAWSVDGLNVVDVITYQVLGDTDFILIEPFILTFNANGGICDVENKLLYHSHSYGDLPVPIKAGYTFKGWYTSATGGNKISSTTIISDGNVTVYAQWTPITYTVRFNANGGQGTMSDMIYVYDEFMALKTNAFTYEDGYIFAGWSLEENGEIVHLNGQLVKNLATTQGEVVTLYAQWTDNYYKANIFIMATSGVYTGSPQRYVNVPAVPNMTIILADEVSKLDVVVDNGLVFDYATDADGNIISAASIAGDSSTVIHFHFKRVQYILTLDANGGEFDTTSGWTVNNDIAQSSRYYGQMYSTLPTVTRDGYTFVGWYTAPSNGAKVSSSTIMGTGNTTIYAVWDVATSASA